MSEHNSPYNNSSLRKRQTGNRCESCGQAYYCVVVNDSGHEQRHPCGCVVNVVDVDIEQDHSVDDHFQSASEIAANDTVADGGENIGRDVVSELRDDGVVYHSIISSGRHTVSTQCGRDINIRDGSNLLATVPDDADDADICDICQSRSYDDDSIRVSPPEGDA